MSDNLIAVICQRVRYKRGKEEIVVLIQDYKKFMQIMCMAGIAAGFYDAYINLPHLLALAVYLLKGMFYMWFYQKLMNFIK